MENFTRLFPNVNSMEYKTGTAVESINPETNGTYCTSGSENDA